MSDYLTERALHLSIRADSPSLIKDVETKTMGQLVPGEVPVRFAVTESLGGQWYCDMGIHVGSTLPHSIFQFEKRVQEDTSSFNVVMLVPTGIGADIGGHAGDATPTAALLANVCDSLITHPNVFNASDMIQIPLECLLCRRECDNLDDDGHCPTSAGEVEPGVGSDTVPQGPDVYRRGDQRRQRCPGLLRAS